MKGELAQLNFIMSTLQQGACMPREDYRELLEVTLIFLGQIPPQEIHFRVPGADYHARWMSKIIYVLKIYLFRSQFKLTKREITSFLEFSLFAALIYVKVPVENRLHSVLSVDQNQRAIHTNSKRRYTQIKTKGRYTQINSYSSFM